MTVQKSNPTHAIQTIRASGGGPLAALAVNAAAGGLAGALSLAAVWPFEFATVRMAADLGAGAERQYGSSE